MKITGESRQWTWVAWPHRGWCWWEIVLFRVFLGVLAWVRTHVGCFVHVDPEAVNVDAVFWVEECVEFAVPVFLDVRMEPVGIRGGTRPYGT